MESWTTWKLFREAKVALEAALAGGSVARAAFGYEQLTAEKTHSADLVTAVDINAEAVIVRILQQVFPEHHILAEEGGDYGPESDWLWVVDPLDGTSNHAIGLPLYGTTVALIHKGSVTVSVVMASHVQRYVIAARGCGVRMMDGSRTWDSTTPVLRGPDIIALQQGYQVPRDSVKLGVLRDRAEAVFSRVLYSWAPSVDALLLLNGDIAGVVGLGCRGLERPAWLLAAKEAGLQIAVSDRHDNIGVPEDYIVAWPEVFPKVMNVAECVLPSLSGAFA